MVIASILLLICSVAFYYFSRVLISLDWITKKTLFKLIGGIALSGLAIGLFLIIITEIF